MPNILAIDDKPDNLITLSAILKNFLPGSHVTTAISGPAGIEKARNEIPDVVLLDIRMPGMDGYEVCKRLKQDEHTRHIPIIMISAILTGSEDIIKGLDSGADAYLPKPVEEHVLVAQVRTALRMKNAEDNLRRQKNLLERLVRERTVELEKTVLQLQVEIAERKRAEDVLSVKQQELESLNHFLEDRIHKAVNEIRQKDQALIQQSRMAAMGEMIGNIAHQWRQPLNALGLIVANIEDAFEFNELTAEYLKKASADCQRLIQKMSSTISDFFHFFRSDRTSSVFSARRQIHEALSLVEASFNNSNITIHCDTEHDVMLQGFPNEFSQVLLNLLSNAKEAIAAHRNTDGRVDIRIETRGDQGCILVEDNGPGIPPDVLDKIFDPYFSTKEQGTGIGLYMSKMIIERHMNGNIMAHNTDSGAMFTVCAPSGDFKPKTPHTI